MEKVPGTTGSMEELEKDSEKIDIQVEKKIISDEMNDLFLMNF